MAEAGELNLGLLLYIPYRAMETAVLDALRLQGHDLPLNQARVFQRIAPAGSRMTALADAAQLTKQTTTSIVDRLEAGGYVERRIDPADSRSRIVHLTARGRRLVALTEPVVAEVETSWTRHLGPDKTAQLRGILIELREVTDPYLA